MLSIVGDVAPDDGTPALIVTVIDGEMPDRLRMAVYDDFDGERWITSSTYRSAPSTYLEEPPPGAAIRYEIEVINLEGPWLPLPDRVTNISPAPLGWDSNSNTALSSRNRRTVVQGTVIDQADSASASGPDVDLAATHTILPQATPEKITELALAAVGDVVDAQAAVVALRDFVQTLGRDDDAPSGHSLGRLVSDLDNGITPGPEQSAALHAILSRSVGVPSRIVVGYRVPEDGTVRTSDLSAWTEVALADIGWVAFDAVPLEASAADLSPGDPGATTTTLPGQTVREADVVPRELNPGERLANQDLDGDDRGLGWVGGTALIILFIALIFLAIAAARYVRRRRRELSGAAAARVAGAWGEILDRLREAIGLGPENRTVDEALDELADLTTEMDRPLRDLTALVNRALYGDRSISSSDAIDAWRLLRDVEGSLKHNHGIRLKCRRLFDPRAFTYRTPQPTPQYGRRPHLPRDRVTDLPRVQAERTRY